MRLRLLYTLLSLLVISTALSAQKLSKTDEANIQERVGAFIKSTKNLDYEGVLDLTYPKIFTIASKENMLELLGSAEAMGMKMMVDAMDIKKIEGLHKNGKDMYALVKYDTRMRIGVSGELASEMAISSLTSSFGDTYGSKNVSFDDEKSEFSVYGEKYMVLINEEAYEGKWFIIEWNTENPDLMKTLLIPEVIKKASKRIK